MAGEQVDDAMEVVPVTYRNFDRNNFRRQVRLHVVEDPLEVGVFLVHLRHE
jgi:hypothetical protein